MRLLIDRARTAFSPDLPSAVQPSILFSMPLSASNVTPITSSTPKMDRVCSVASVCAIATFTRSLDLFRLPADLSSYFSF